MENTDFETASASVSTFLHLAKPPRDGYVIQPVFQSLASQGILLDSYYGVTHPSEPNYVATVGGDFWGMANDNLFNIPKK
jgi:hypothetical protein